MCRKLFVVFIGIVFLESSLGLAYPVSWNQLTKNFLSSISTQGRLKPNFASNVEEFFSVYFDRDNQQLLFVEAGGDTILDFLAFNCHGVTKQLTRKDPNTARIMQIAAEHLFYQVLLRFDRLDYWDLTNVIHRSLSGRYNTLHTLIQNNLFSARDRLLYFLIDKSLNKFESQSSSGGWETPSLIELTREALGDSKVRRSLELELDWMRQPLVWSWEETFHRNDFLERESARRRKYPRPTACTRADPARRHDAARNRWSRGFCEIPAGRLGGGARGAVPFDQHRESDLRRR